MTYLANPSHFTKDEFRALVDSLSWTAGWLPQFPTLHNTGVPSLTQWKGWGATPQERWGENLNRYYKGLGWHSGVHLVCCPDYIWNLCDLRSDGVSVSCWNHVTIGIECVGNYEAGGDNWDTGDGAKVRDNAAWALAVLSHRLNWRPSDLHFHRECPQDGHPCPGSKVSKADMISRVGIQMAQFSLTPPAPAAAFTVLSPIGSVKWIQGKVGVAIDGVAGPITIAAIKTFQTAHGLTADGIVGPETIAALS